MKDFETKTTIEALKEDFPKMPEHFENVVREALKKQMQELPLTARTEKKRKKLVPVIAAATLFFTGGAVIAGTNITGTDGLSLIKSWLKPKSEAEESTAAFIQNGAAAKVTTEGTPFEAPLWEISDVWYDGASLVFVGTATEEGLKYDTGSDHILINGTDCLMNYYDTDESDKRNVYFCQVDIPEEYRTEKLEVLLNLKAWNRGVRGVFAPGLKGRQEIRFTVEKAGQVAEIKDRVIPLKNGEAEVHSLSAAVSGVSIDFTYRFREEDAEALLQEMNYSFVVKDSFGNQGKASYQSIGDIRRDEDGNWCRHFTVGDVKGMDSHAKSYTVIPRSAQVAEEWKDEGKLDPATAKKLEYGTFTVQMKE